MQKYIVLLFLGLFFITTSASNLTIQPRFTSSFRFTPIDVWNIDVQFMGSSNVNAYLLATITANGRPICTVKSGAVVLTPGAQSFTPVSMSTAQLNYQSQAIGDIENITGTYPSGIYKVCYTAYCVTTNCDGLGSNALYNEYPECFEMIVEPPTPILLAYPEDQTELEWKRPTFNWIPPMPLSGVEGFNYDYLLVERDKKQTCADAIIRNRPLYKQAGIEQPTLPYPGELNELDTGKNYCWKVNGLVEDIPVAQSEVWEFKLVKEEKEKQDTFRYAEFTTKLNSGNIALKNNTLLYFVCAGSYDSELLNLKITGDNLYSYNVQNTSDGIEKVEIHRPNEDATILNHFGTNKYALDLSKVPGLIEGYYTIEIIGENHIAYFLKIKISN